MIKKVMDRAGMQCISPMHFLRRDRVDDKKRKSYLLWRIYYGSTGGDPVPAGVERLKAFRLCCL